MSIEEIDTKTPTKDSDNKAAYNKAAHNKIADNKAADNQLIIPFDNRKLIVRTLDQKKNIDLQVTDSQNKLKQLQTDTAAEKIKLIELLEKQVLIHDEYNYALIQLIGSKQQNPNI
jgi:hypothetical protein